MFSVVQKSQIYNSNVLAMSRWLFQIKQNKEQQKNQQQRAQFSINNTHLEVASPTMKRGLDYIKDPKLNKGLAFTLQERQVLGLQGLLAANIKTLAEQVEICRLSFERYKHPLNKYLYLCQIHQTNERLFFALLNTDIERFLPIVYTPTVGLACQKFGFAYNDCRGLFISIKDRCHIYNVLKNWPIHDVRAIVVTDGERILGLGDLGAYGMGIPIGKLCLYTALAGVKPHQCLPITLDTGTNTESLLVDPLYIGIRNKRVRGEEYDDFIEEFMEACVKRFGRRVLIQFEDFGLLNAPRLLEKYQKRYCVFNDDIQGTAGVILAGFIAATRITKVKLSDNIYLFMGAGAAGAGIASLLVDAMIDEGTSLEQAQKKIFLYDIDGLVTSKRSSGIPKHCSRFPNDMEPEKDFGKLVKMLKPTVLIGVAAQFGSFTPEILKQMAKNTERPQIFALSNPTIKTECTAQQAYDNTEGRCIYASGSPFPPVKYNNKTYYTGQGNNSYIFPGVALGIIAANITQVGDYLFLAAAKCVANMVSEEDLNVGRVYPPLTDIRKISLKIAEEIVVQAYKHDVANCMKPDNICEFIKTHVYNLEYPNCVPDIYEYAKKDEYTPKSVKEIADMHLAKTKKKC